MSVSPENIVARSANLPSRRGERISLPAQIGDVAAQRVWQQKVRSDDELVLLDLFCGAGGLSQGFQDEGFFIAAGVDFDERCVETHGFNFLSKSLALDMTGVTDEGVKALILDRLGLPRVDVIVGGPPCQGFANVGRAKIRSLAEDQREKLLKRNHLYREFVQFVGTLKPLCFVMENVPQLATFEGGRIKEKIRDDFDRLGYDIGTTDSLGEPLLLDAAAFGVPQTRRRLFFIGFLRGRIGPIRTPAPTHNAADVESRFRAAGTSLALPLDVPRAPVKRLRQFLPQPLTLADAISDLPRIHAPTRQSPEFLAHVQPYSPASRTDLTERGAFRDPNYRRLMRRNMDESPDSEVIFDHVVRPVREDDAEAFRHMHEGGAYADVPETYRRYRLAPDHFEDRYFRMPWDQPSRTITAHIAKDGYWYIHPDVDQGRTLSVREAARIQSFPDRFRFAGHRTTMYRQIGNAVPSLLARAIARQVRDAIERGGSSLWEPRVWFEQSRLPFPDQRVDQNVAPNDPVRASQW